MASPLSDLFLPVADLIRLLLWATASIDPNILKKDWEKSVRQQSDIS
jgi:hypothetical protein